MNIITELLELDEVVSIALDPQGTPQEALEVKQVAEVLTDYELPLEDQLDALDVTIQMIRKRN